MRKQEAERFWKKVRKTDGCWIWEGARSHMGHGGFWSGGRVVKAHRWAYEERFGNINEGLLACHKCDNPPCVNPDHIFLGSHKDNCDDAYKKGRRTHPIPPRPKPGSRQKRTHCRRGHMFTAETIYVRPKGRECLICKRMVDRARLLKSKGA